MSGERDSAWQRFQEARRRKRENQPPRAVQTITAAVLMIVFLLLEPARILAIYWLGWKDMAYDASWIESFKYFLVGGFGFLLGGGGGSGGARDGRSTSPPTSEDIRAGKRDDAKSDTNS